MLSLLFFLTFVGEMCHDLSAALKKTAIMWREYFSRIGTKPDTGHDGETGYL